MPQTSSRSGLDEILAQVRDAFRDGPPNGWLLGWDPDRLIAGIQGLTPSDCQISNRSSFDYSFCNSFEIKFPAVKNKYLVLITKVSFIADVFCLYWVRYKHKGGKGNVIPSPETAEQCETEKSLRSFLEAMEFSELPAEWHSARVEGVRLELAECGSVTLDKCLFEDHAG